MIKYHEYVSNSLLALIFLADSILQIRLIWWPMHSIYGDLLNISQTLEKMRGQPVTGKLIPKINEICDILEKDLEDGGRTV